MVKPLRIERLEEQFKREISELILSKARDPRIKNATILGIEIDRELELAKVYVSIIGNEDEKKIVMDALKKASGFFRSELAFVLEIRKIPKIKFVLDHTMEESIRIDSILTELGYPRKDDE